MGRGSQKSILFLSGYNFIFFPIFNENPKTYAVWKFERIDKMGCHSYYLIKKFVIKKNQEN